MQSACCKHYTGKTTQYMHMWHTGHRREKESSELGKLFSSCGLENIVSKTMDYVIKEEDDAMGGENIEDINV